MTVMKTFQFQTNGGWYRYLIEHHFVCKALY